MAKTAKRRRKKERRRQEIERLVREYRARRRTRIAIGVAVLLVIGGTAAAVAIRDRPGERRRPAGGTVACDGRKPPAGNPSPLAQPPEQAIDPAKTYTATVETSCGTVTIALADDVAPRTVNSFVFLARRGFFDGLTFHRVVPGFAIQGGDPGGDGQGGPGYSVTEAPPPGTRYERGTVAMAKTARDPPGTSGSQFFIVPGDGAGTLPPEYALLGRVTSGFETLQRIEQVPRGARENPERPTRTVYIEKVTIAET